MIAWIILGILYAYGAGVSTFWLIQQDELKDIKANFTDIEVIGLPAMMLFAWPWMIYQVRKYG